MMNGKKTILIVDDEPKIRELLGSYAEAGGYRAALAADGKSALSVFERGGVSLILLDLMLPDMSGEELCAAVRRVSDVPVIMITARADEESVIRGLKSGADDYVCKPFSPRQVMARVEAALRRSAGAGRGAAGAPPAELEYNGLRLSSAAGGAAFRDGKPLSLTRDEYRALSLFLSHPGRLFTRDQILDAVKGGDFTGFDRSVDSLIKRLRIKLGGRGRGGGGIVTVYGMGYRLGDAP